MNIIESFNKGILRECYLIVERMASIIPDAAYLKLVYRIRVGKKLNLKTPTSISEKLQWLKLYNRKAEYTKMVDKYEMKAIVAEKIGKEHVIPALGVWDSFDKIDFSELPEKFVLKCTHDSGSVIICTDRSKFDKKRARKKLESALKRNYFWGGREWPYKNVTPRIMAEPYIEGLGNPDSIEYKITCFDGKLGFSTICTGVAHSTLNVRKNDFYDKDFNMLPFWAFYKHSENPITEKPDVLDEIIDYAEIIAEGVPYLRVDFYVLDGNVYFGEATFFTWSGFLKFEPKDEDWDKKLGELLKLPEKKTI